jgi:predicted dienelactone hydrolase
MIPTRSHATLVIAFLAVSSGVALEQRAAAASCRTVPQLGIEAFDAPGPHPVGVRTATFVDTSRPTPAAGSFAEAPERTLVTEMWYPALAPGRDAAVDAAGGSYPVVIYSHGGGGDRLDGTLVGQHLASRGMIVASPEYPLTNVVRFFGAGLVALEDIANQPADWSVVLDGVLAAFGAAADPGRVGATGHSLGAITTQLVTYHRGLRDPRIRAAMSLAGGGCFLTRRFYREVRTPLLIMHADSDQLTRFSEHGRTAYRRARRPRFLVRLQNGSHFGFAPGAAGLDPSAHYDRVLCPVIHALEPNDAETFFPALVTPLGDREVGIHLTPDRCSRLCTDPVPDRPAMPAVRHHQLTLATEAAFFQAYLLDDAAARCFLRRTLGSEPDVTVRSKGAAAPARLLRP